MILKNQIITNIKIESVNDLYKLKPFVQIKTIFGGWDIED